VYRHETRISLGAEPVPVPEPFAGMLKDHLHKRPNLRTTGGIVATSWPFAGQYPGNRPDTQTTMFRLRGPGINPLGGYHIFDGLVWAGRAQTPYAPMYTKGAHACGWVGSEADGRPALPEAIHV
jgi:hypothetical protein